MGDDVLRELRQSLGVACSAELQAATPRSDTGDDIDEHGDTFTPQRPDSVIGQAALDIAEQLLGESAGPRQTPSAARRHAESPGRSAVPGPPLLVARGERAPLADGPVVLGRGREAFSPTDDGRVSRQHCAVQSSDDGSIYAIDLGSVNGTQIERDGARIVVSDQWVELKVGDVLVTTEGVVLAELVGEAEADR